MRAWIPVALFVVTPCAALAWSCGGTTTGGGLDASADHASSSSSGSGSGSSSGSTGSSSGSSSGVSSSSGSGSGGNCPSCTNGLICCNGVDCSIDQLNDPRNCGACGHACAAPTPYCSGGSCHPQPCELDAGQCGAAGSCCGTSCCAGGQICCELEGPVSGPPTCFTPTAQSPSCPVGCTQCVSDRNVKHAIEPVDPQAVLEGLARVPVETWAYDADPSVRHMGPMAQDFYGEFGLGGTDKAYSPIDAHGVAFAAIQALRERLEAQQARIDKLERDNAELRRALTPARRPPRP